MCVCGVFIHENPGKRKQITDREKEREKERESKLYGSREDEGKECPAVYTIPDGPSPEAFTCSRQRDGWMDGIYLVHYILSAYAHTLTK